MENHATNQIIGNTAGAPYLNTLSNDYGTATRYYGITHPSLPNYLAAISGSFQGIWDDCPAGVSVTCAPEAFTSSLTSNQYASASNQPHMFNGQTIVDQLEAHHLTWKAYMQSMPSAGYTGDSYAGLYAQKHDPFMYFASIRQNAADRTFFAIWAGYAIEYYPQLRLDFARCLQRYAWRPHMFSIR